MEKISFFLFYFSFGRILKVLERNIGYIVGFTSVILFIYFFIFTSNQRRSFDDEIFPFAFEWYYNYIEYGSFTVGSMDITTYDHYFYLTDETLLKGHGISAFGGHSPYPHSDAGYTNNLVFGGIPFFVCLVIYQILYSARPIAITLKNRSREGKIDRVFFLLLFVYLFAVEIKAPAVGYLHIAEVMYVALGSAYILNYYLQRKQEKLSK